MRRLDLEPSAVFHSRPVRSMDIISEFRRKKLFQDLHRQLTEQELEELEKSLREDGLQEPIIVMQGDVIVDGDHREKLCRKLGIKPRVRVKQFENDAEAVQWILRLQLARRNLSPHDYKLARGRLYNTVKQSHGGSRKSDDKKLSSSQNENLKNGTIPGENTAKVIADETGSAPSSVLRSGKYAEQFDRLPEGVRNLIHEKPSRATEKAVEAMAAMDATTLTPLARQVRVGQVPSFDAALGFSTRGQKQSDGRKRTAKSKNAGKEFAPLYAALKTLVQQTDKIVNARVEGGTRKKVELRPYHERMTVALDAMRVVLDEWSAQAEDAI